MRIGIVNDVQIAVEALRRVLTAEQEHQIAWVAQDGVEAVARCARDRPDLILMDLVMPRMDGVEATRRIMAATPCPIVIVTASVQDYTAMVFEAMGAGALDVVNTPVHGGLGSVLGAKHLLAKVEPNEKEALRGASLTSFGAKSLPLPEVEFLVVDPASGHTPLLEGIPEGLHHADRAAHVDILPRCLSAGRDHLGRAQPAVARRMRDVRAEAGLP